MARNAAGKRIVEKADPEFVRGVLDSIFENTTEQGARRHYEEFLAESIEMLAGQSRALGRNRFPG